MKLGPRQMTLGAAALMLVWLIGVVVMAAGAVKESPEAAIVRQNAQATATVRALVDARLAGLQAAQGGAQKSPVMVEDVFKNVQALKTMTVDEFMGTMGLMSASLGLCCNDCHPGAGTDKVVWESDENPRKVRAREMAFMVQAINRDNFNGQQVVTCWTCHRLRLTPLQTPKLDQFYGEAITELDDVVSKADRSEERRVGKECRS